MGSKDLPIAHIVSIYVTEKCIIDSILKILAFCQLQNWRAHEIAMPSSSIFVLGQLPTYNFAPSQDDIWESSVIPVPKY